MTQDLFAVLADPTRRAILEALVKGESPVGDVVQAVGASQPTVSKHLRVLRSAGLVQQRADGQRRLYSIQPEGLDPVGQWIDQFAEQEPTPQVTHPQRGGFLTSVFRRRRR
ncbi:MAG: metalloregulator ArsR/SmtB family transcription factor [Kocuria sp.]|nr:metalloregulator ArsR/SmtB family transcription factor [Kocuria sp.]